MNDAAPITPRVDFARELAGLFDLSGKTAFVPGGTGGLGEAIAWGLALSGASVVIAARDRGKAERLAGAIEKGAKTQVGGVPLEVTSLASIEEATAQAHDRLGRIDILVNSVGIQIEQPLLEVTEEAYDKVYATNLKSAMFLAQAVAKRQVAAAQGGRQIHLLSVRSQLALRGKGYSAYCSTKGGLVMLVRQHAMELAPHGITVNGVAPTFVNTEMIQHVYARPEFREAILARIPLGRIADPKDVVGAVLFLASPAAGFVTGQVLYVDGGITASQ
ncbi:MAG TPA: SDR family oxidoreductase [Beijerinckiaceae bacterium]|nr:alcohol dehydrogenase [Microvirga sp.]HZB39185.1 SDR family oxidoreductase [Beijerinckiaceae bacterium]